MLIPPRVRRCDGNQIGKLNTNVLTITILVFLVFYENNKIPSVVMTGLHVSRSMARFNPNKNYMGLRILAIWYDNQCYTDGSAGSFR